MMATIDDDLIATLKSVFVTRDELHSVKDEVDGKLSNDMRELAVINTKVSLVLWLLGAVGVAVIGVLIKLIFNT